MTSLAREIERCFTTMYFDNVVILPRESDIDPFVVKITVGDKTANYICPGLWTSLIQLLVSISECGFRDKTKQSNVA